MFNNLRGSFINLCAILVFLPVLLAPEILCAETLSDFEQTIASYQENPAGRIVVLRAEVENIRSTKNALAIQYDVPVSRVVKYESLLHDIIKIYNDMYFLQRCGTFIDDKLTLNMDATLLTSAKPPYSFLMYLDVLEDAENCRDSIEYCDEKLNDITERLRENDLSTEEAEKLYRKCASEIEGGTKHVIALNWEMQEIKSYIEYTFANKSLYLLTKQVTKSTRSTAVEWLELVEPMLDKIVKNIKFDDADFATLDSIIARRTERLEDITRQLDERLTLISGMKTTSDSSEFMNFWMPAELALIYEEVKLLQNIISASESQRLIWHYMRDLLERRLPISEQKEVLMIADTLTNRASTTIATCNLELQVIRAISQKIWRKFSDTNANMSDEDRKLRDDFLMNIEARRNRYLSYINDTGSLYQQAKMLQKETHKLLEQKDPEEKVQYYWHKYVDGIMDFEIYHFEDYPLTPRNVFSVLFIFAVGLFITRGVVYFFTRHAKRNEMSKHSILVVRKFIYYTGFIISVLCSLWSLKIPKTAFAFVGGAAAIALGFGTQKLAGDIFCGILLLFQRKIRVGDIIEIGGIIGTVTEVTLYNTVIRCDESKHFIIPNSKVYDSSLVNITIDGANVRTTLDIGIAYGSDIEQATEMVKTILCEDQEVLKEPAPVVLFSEFEDSSLKLTAQFFYDIKNTSGAKLKSRLRHKILAAFNDAGIDIPFPQTEVHIKEG